MVFLQCNAFLKQKTLKNSKTVQVVTVKQCRCGNDFFYLNSQNYSSVYLLPTSIYFNFHGEKPFIGEKNDVSKSYLVHQQSTLGYFMGSLLWEFISFCVYCCVCFRCFIHMPRGRLAAYTLFKANLKKANHFPSC